ncbi:ADP compounds hydrolase NudE [Thiofilum flexile]|uniref:ADP compounds hydrolase NudE n=1 Tax=Thiofilum flexile TaxID=125627 RepID=UPI00035C368C|nr:ADP compounds hydrolase NudE [Thiofilum flexile]
MSNLPTIHEKRLVASSRIFRIEELDLTFSNGVTRTYERLASRGIGGVLIVPLLADYDTVLMIREYSAGTERYELAFPKGAVEMGEDLLIAANRELMEEVGHGARQLELLKRITLSPGYMGHKTNIVLATELYPATAEGDEPEPLEVVPCKLSELDELIARDELSEGRSILALFMVRDWVRARQLRS